jgi:uncharacterized protein
MTANSTRLSVVDALRGFAIVSIMLLHNIEHFDFYFTPTGLPQWMPAVDNHIWDTLFFLFGGKSYAIFALLFGLTFFIQSDNQARKGKDFRGRFAWRMLLLLGFGIINSAFYEGDILTIYAIIGFFIIPFANMGNRAVFWIALLLMAQPYEWYNVFWGMSHPDAAMTDPASWAYFGKAGEYITKDSLWGTWIGNLTNGKKAVLLWTWENCRVFQTLSLFLLGMLAGRLAYFKVSQTNKLFWVRVLALSTSMFVLLYWIKRSLGGWVSSEAIRRPLESIETSWINMVFMGVLVSGFVILYQSVQGAKVLNVFVPIGRMSLSNYLFQSLVGSVIYYGFGLGLYQYTGATYCLSIGITLAVLQGLFSRWWMGRHAQGPLETLWHKATWIGAT